MTREKKIEAIYKEMANKELTLGCKVKIKYDNISYGEALEEIRNPVEEILTVSLGGVAIKDNIEIEKYQILSADSNGYIEDLETLVQIIGHPVMIGDVMDYLEDKSRSQFDDEEDEEYFYSREEYYEDIAELSDCWVDKRLPIDNQSDECIDFVHSLIQKS